MCLKLQLTNCIEIPRPQDKKEFLNQIRNFVGKLENINVTKILSSDMNNLMNDFIEELEKLKNTETQQVWDILEKKLKEVQYEVHHGFASEPKIELVIRNLKEVLRECGEEVVDLGEEIVFWEPSAQKKRSEGPTVQDLKNDFIDQVRHVIAGLESRISEMDTKELAQKLGDYVQQIEKRRKPVSCWELLLKKLGEEEIGFEYKGDKSSFKREPKRDFIIRNLYEVIKESGGEIVDVGEELITSRKTAPSWATEDEIFNIYKPTGTSSVESSLTYSDTSKWEREHERAHLIDKVKTFCAILESLADQELTKDEVIAKYNEFIQEIQPMKEKDSCKDLFEKMNADLEKMKSAAEEGNQSNLLSITKDVINKISPIETEVGTEAITRFMTTDSGIRTPSPKPITITSEEEKEETPKKEKQKAKKKSPRKRKTTKTKTPSPKKRKVEQKPEIKTVDDYFAARRKEREERRKKYLEGKSVVSPRKKANFRTLLEKVETPTRRDRMVKFFESRRHTM